MNENDFLHKKTALIANPSSGGGRGAVRTRELTNLLKGMNIEPDILISQKPGHAIELGRQVKAGDYGCLLVLGGDGTISEVVKGLYGSDIPVATIPCGSCNDLAGTLGIPRKLEQAIEVISQGKTIRIDLFKDYENICAETIGCGFAADVAAAAIRLSRHFSGPISYFAGVLETLSRFKTAEYHILIDGEEWQGFASMVLINNTYRVGGGMKLTPEAEIDDGYLDIIIVNTSNKYELLRLLPLVYSGRHVKSPNVIIRRGRKFKVDSSHRLRKMADGDIIGTLPMDVEIIPSAMNFICA